MIVLILSCFWDEYPYNLSQIYLFFWLMSSSIFLFTGENSYTLSMELTKWKSQFAEKFGEDALFEFTDQNWDFWQIKQALYASGLFVSKKMVVLYGIPKDWDDVNALSSDKIDQFFDDFLKNKDLISPDTLVLLVSRKPDKRTRAYKWFLENAQLKEFPLYKEIQLKNFLKEELAPLAVSDVETSHFLLKVGNDMFRLHNEAQKLKLWLQSRGATVVTNADIDEFCFGKLEQDSFEIFDQMFSDPIATVKIFEKMQDDGKNRNEVMGLLTRGIKIYLTLLDFDQRGITSGKEIIAETKLHPFVVNKNLKLVPMLRGHRSFLIAFFKQLIELESQIKLGKKSDLYFWLFLKSQILSLRS